MYSKFFLVFFSLFLLLLSGLADRFQKLGATKASMDSLTGCRMSLSPMVNPRATHLQLIREDICGK